MNEITPCRTPQRNHEIGTGVASDVIGYPITSLATPALRLLRGAFPVIGFRHSGCCSSAAGRGEAAGSDCIYNPSSLLTFDLMGISMWVSMGISMWVSMDTSMEMSI